jgi:nucleotide-binding universal stress UspA family protein
MLDETVMDNGDKQAAAAASEADASENSRASSRPLNHTRKILLAVDGSEHSRRAVDFLVTRIKRIGCDKVILVNVQPVQEFMALAMNPDVILGELRNNGEKVLAEPRQRLDVHGIPYEERLEFGEVAQSIVKVAREEGCEQIIMGTRGQGAIAGLLLGSVATNVLQLTDVPVTLVK